jgi:prevent-host-death family protein
MARSEVGIRELKSRLSAYLRQVEEGEMTIIITKRGKPIGQIAPLARSTEERLEALEQAGLIVWSGGRLSPLAPVAQAQGDRTIADLLLEDRE